MKQLPRFALSALLLVCAMQLQAQNASVPEIRITANQQLLDTLEQSREARATGSLDFRTYTTLALIASGATDAQGSELERKIEELCGRLREELAQKQPIDNKAKADRILSFMFTAVLSRYSEFQTRFDVALLQGSYNCVSSAVLFTIFAKASGLETGAVETPDHAFCTIVHEGRLIDIETTNPYGVDPGSKRELSSQENAKKTWVIVPQTKYRNRKPATELRLLALIYNNRISELEKKGNFAQAVPLAVDSWHLENASGSFDLTNLPDRTLMTERFLNYAVSLSRQKRGLEGLAFIRSVASLWGFVPEYRDYADSVVGEELNALMKKGAFDEAEKLLEQTADIVHPSVFTEMGKGLTYNRLNNAINAAGVYTLEQILSDIKSAASILGEKDTASLTGYAWLTEADKYAKKEQWLDAARIIERGLSENPENRDMTTARRVYRENYAIVIHNRAAIEFNKGNKDAMKAILEEGLSNIPESILLQNDLSRLRTK